MRPCLTARYPHMFIFFKKTRVSKVSESLDAEGIWMCAHTIEIQWVISLDYQSVWTGTLGPGWTVNNEFSHEHQRLFDTIEQSVLLVLKKSDKWQLHLKCRSHEPLSPLSGYKSWEAVASYTLNTELSSENANSFWPTAVRSAASIPSVVGLHHR